jgi:hypothetical protein
VVAEVVYAAYDHSIINANEPSSKKTASTCTRHDHSQVRHHKRLCREEEWSSIWPGGESIGGNNSLHFFGRENQ